MVIDKGNYREGSARFSRICADLTESAIFSGAHSVGSVVCDDGFSLYSFSSGEVIYDRENYDRSLGIVIKGKALIYKGSGSRKVLICEKGKGGLFGAAALFGECERYASRIEAKGRETVIAFISQDLMKRTIEADPAVGIKYIEFLSGKIRYLNSKLDIYTGTTPSEKIVSYLRSCGGKADVSMQKLSRELDIPRATLYRTVGKLEKEGAVTREGKLIKISKSKR